MAWVNFVDRKRITLSGLAGTSPESPSMETRSRCVIGTMADTDWVAFLTEVHWSRTKKARGLLNWLPAGHRLRLHKPCPCLHSGAAALHFLFSLSLHDIHDLNLTGANGTGGFRRTSSRTVSTPYVFLSTFYAMLNHWQRRVMTRNPCLARPPN